MTVRIALSLLVIMTSLACNSVGPRALRTAQQPYNQALAQSQDEEILLNLLRIAEGRKPQFLKIEKVTTSYKFSASAGIGVSLTEALTRTSGMTSSNDSKSSNTVGRSDGNTDGFSANLGGMWQESPTVSYLPLTGEDFARRILSPISLENLALLFGAGYDGELLTKLFIARAGELYGDSSRLESLAENIGILQTNDYLEIFPAITEEPDEEGKKEEKTTKVFISWRTHNGFVPKEACEFICTLPAPDCPGGSEAFCDKCPSLADGSYQEWISEESEECARNSKQEFFLSEGAKSEPGLPKCPPPWSSPPSSPGEAVDESEGLPPGVPLMGTRSLAGAVRRALDIPVGKARVDLLDACSPGGEARGELRISCSDRRPTESEAFLSVRHRGKWFFIPAREEMATQAYLMLSFLYTMQAGPAQPSNSADVVIPVGGI